MHISLAAAVLNSTIFAASMNQTSPRRSAVGGKMLRVQAGFAAQPHALALADTSRAALNSEPVFQFGHTG
jgi:hypothetical protein